MKRESIPTVVQQHAQDAASLRNARTSLVRAPHVKLNQLRRLDDRLAAHLDGLEVAGEYGSQLATAALESPGRGEVFTAAVRAIEGRDPAGLDRVIALVQALPDSPSGLMSAFGWVSAASLRGITSALLASPDPFRRRIGIAACAMHGVDPGDALVAAAGDDEAALRARALRAMASSGRVEHLAACVRALADVDAHCAFEAARAAVLLGERQHAPSVLHRLASTAGPWRAAALGLLLRLSEAAEAHAALKPLSQQPADARLLIRGMGMAGDARYVPWLIQQMQDAKLARLAGESFSLITGLDLAGLNLDGARPDTPEGGPSDDPDAGDVAMDEDEGLPWPGAGKIGAWWQAHGQRLAEGVRLFMGEPPSVAHCRPVLRTGFQRQRTAAAEWLCLLQPGTPLFNTAAPAWRQQRWLTQMGV